MVGKAGQGELKVGQDLSGGYDPDGVGFVFFARAPFGPGGLVAECIEP